MTDLMRASTRNRRLGVTPPRFEQILNRVGDYGKHQQRLLYGFLLPLAFYLPFAASSLSLLLATPDHHCMVPARELVNASRSIWRMITIPWIQDTSGRTQYSRCLMRNVTFPEDTETGLTHLSINIDANTTCQYGWEWDRSTWDETAVSQFGWVCQHAHVVTTIKLVATASSVVGTMVFAALADRFGRRPMFLTCVVLSSVFGILNVYSNNWIMFVVTKAISATASFAMYQLPFIMVIEQSSGAMRVRAAALCAIAVTLGMAAVALCAWLTQTWTTLAFVCYGPGLLLFIYWRFLPESPRWLLSKGRVEECSSVLHSIAERNGRTDPPELLKVLCELKKEQRKKSPLMSLLSLPSLRKRIIILSLKTCIMSIVYTGLLQNIRNVTNNEFVNFFALSLVDIPGNLLGMMSAQYLGRRLTTIYTQLLAAAFCFLASVATTNHVALSILCSAGKLFLTSSVVVVFVQTGELFPTPLRTLVYGFVGSLGVVTTLVASPIMALGILKPRLPYYILGLLSLVSASMSSLLPETLGRELPQTTQEANNIGYGHRFCACIHHWNVHKIPHDDDDSGDEQNLSETTKTFVSTAGNSYFDRA